MHEKKIKSAWIKIDILKVQKLKRTKIKSTTIKVKFKHTQPINEKVPCCTTPIFFR